MFSNGSLAGPEVSLASLDELAESELDQKKLLCGSKRLYNKTTFNPAATELLDSSSPLSDGYLKSPFKTRGREALTATSITKK